MHNTLLLFKDHDSRMAGYAQPDKIFFHEKCTGNRASYSLDVINKIFANDFFNPEALKERMISLMIYLQKGYHKETYDGPAANYPYAQKEYPKRYIALVEGLNDETLTAIKTFKDDTFIPGNAAESFCQQLLCDREKLSRSHAINPNQTAETPALAM